MLGTAIISGFGIFMFGITVTSIFAKTFVMMEEDEQRRK